MYTMIIADDEKIAYKSFELFIKKEFPAISIIGIAEDGLSMISLIKEKKPDLAIVDVNMPGINGIDAISILKAEEVKTRYIINTAYDEFDYVKKAIDLEVDGYFLKPEKRDNMVHTISRLLKSIEEQKKDEEDKNKYLRFYQEMRPVLENEVMYSIFMNDNVENSVTSYCKSWGSYFQGGAIVTIINLSNSLEHKSELKSFIKSVIDGLCSNIVQVTDAGISILIFFYTQEEEQLEWVKDLLLILMDSLNKQKNGYRAGIGRLTEKASELSLSYQESLAALRKGEDVINFFGKEEKMTEQYPGFITLSKLADQIISCLITGSSKEADEILERFFMNTDHSREDYASFMSLCIKRAVDYKKDFKIDHQAVSGSIMSVFRKTPKEELLPLLKARVKQLSQMFFEEPETVSAGYVTQAVEYIRNEFAQSISLDTAADKIGISPFYLSRLMKQELGVTFIEYLTMVRMSEAVRLAEETNDTLQVIAQKTGYTNVTYFCKVFKKNMGKTIGEWRRNLGNDL